MSDKERIAPISREQWDDDVRTALRRALGDDVSARYLAETDALPLPNGVAVFMHHPKLAGRFLAFNFELLRNPVLDPRLRELMILRVAWKTRSDYEWMQHVRIGLGAGITAAEIDAIKAPQSHAWAPLEAAALAATDQLIDGHVIDDDTWRALADELDDRSLVELVFVVGTYTASAMLFNSLGLQLDPDLQALASDAPYAFEE